MRFNFCKTRSWITTQATGKLISKYLKQFWDLFRLRHRVQMSKFFLRPRSATRYGKELSFQKKQCMTMPIFEEQIYSLYCEFFQMNPGKGKFYFPTFLSNKRKAYTVSDKNELRKLKSCADQFSISTNILKSRFTKNPKIQAFYYSHIYQDKMKFIGALKQFKNGGDLVYKEKFVPKSKIFSRFKRPGLSRENSKHPTNTKNEQHKDSILATIGNELDRMRVSSNLTTRPHKPRAPSQNNFFLNSSKSAVVLPTSFQDIDKKDNINFKFKKFSNLMFHSFKAKMQQEKQKSLTRQLSLYDRCQNPPQKPQTERQPKITLVRDKESLYIQSKLKSFSIRNSVFLNVLKANYASSTKIGDTHIGAVKTPYNRIKTTRT
jgi:hypothetical protein